MNKRTFQCDSCGVNYEATTLERVLDKGMNYCEKCWSTFKKINAAINGGPVEVELVCKGEIEQLRATNDLSKRISERFESGELVVRQKVRLGEAAPKHIVDLIERSKLLVALIDEMGEVLELAQKQLEYWQRIVREEHDLGHLAVDEKYQDFTTESDERNRKIKTVIRKWRTFQIGGGK